MDRRQASEIATLINTRNQLTRKYTSDDVLKQEPTFEYEERQGHVIGCVERKRVQWYQWEVLHLSVNERWARQGIGRLLFDRAEAAARAGAARMLQCTIREGNDASEQLFTSAGFSKTARFANTTSGNVVGVWSKVLAAPVA